MKNEISPKRTQATISVLVILISKILCERIFFGFDYFTRSSVKCIISITGLFKGCFNFHPILVSVVIHWEFSLILLVMLVSILGMSSLCGFDDSV